MKKRDPLSLRTDARNVVNEPGPGGAAPLERRVEIIHREADVMDRRPSFRNESPDRRVGLARLQELDNRPSRVESRDPRAVGVGQVELLQSEYFPVEGQRFGD